MGQEDPVNFIFPPRPRGKIDPDHLARFAVGDWIAQWKYNGTRNLIHVEADRFVRLYQRHGKPHSQYKLDDATREQILSLDLVPGEGYILDGELLHAKSRDVKGIMVLYDVLYEGCYLAGTTVGDRIARLTRICRDPQLYEPGGRALRVAGNIWLAPTFGPGDFASKYAQAIPDALLEGLVLKRRDARLIELGGREYEVDWQLRVRKPHPGGNYRR